MRWPFIFYPMRQRNSQWHWISTTAYQLYLPSTNLPYGEHEAFSTFDVSRAHPLSFVVHMAREHHSHRDGKYDNIVCDAHRRPTKQKSVHHTHSIQPHRGARERERECACISRRVSVRSRAILSHPLSLRGKEAAHQTAREITRMKRCVA